MCVQVIIYKHHEDTYLSSRLYDMFSLRPHAQVLHFAQGNMRTTSCFKQYNHICDI